MIRNAKKIDWADPSLVGKFVLFKTAMVYGLVGAVFKIEKISKPRLTAVHARIVTGGASEQNLADDLSRLVKDIQSVLFVCDTFAEASKISEMSVKVAENFHAANQLCREDSYALVGTSLP